MTGFGAVRNVARVPAGRERRRHRGGRRRAAGARRRQARGRRADRRRRPRRRASSRGPRERGADHVVDTSTDERVVRTLRTLTGGGADHAFEVVGLPETMLLAWKAIRPGATAVVVGLAEKGVDVAPAGDRLPLRQGHPRELLRLGRPGARTSPRSRELALAGELDLAGVVTHVDDARRRRRGARTAPARRGRAYHPRDRPRDRGRADTDRRRLRMTTISEGPRSVADAVAGLDIRAQAFIDGEYVDARLGRDVRRRQPDQRRGRRARSRRATRPTSTARSPARAPRSSRASGRGSRRRSGSRRSSGSPS